MRKVLAARTYWTKSMHNSFLVVLDISSEGQPVEYVLDPNFKEQFRVGVMSRAYRWVDKAAAEQGYGSEQRYELIALGCCSVLRRSPQQAAAADGRHEQSSSSSSRKTRAE